ncbi:pilus assembly protein PilM [Clostridium disporicum]|uniref:Type IV pilus assembly protein PilM n=1 Tax=Clostridium disporicum TaxID=84024 RepID=A0A174AB68_9CLOT|nr:pilus assembly protein PilM [Clostridium disporicum]CUN85463.1 type IV pilus assembly protein PilM [Clostridium disporicum]
MSIVNNKKLSIQITDTSINILIGNKNKIYETHTIELENGDCKDGNVRDKDSIVKLLNDYLDVNGRDVKNVSFVLRGSDIITRYIEVPILKNDALIEAVNFEFKQFIPDIDDYYMNYEIVEKINTKEKKAYKILLVAATKEKINPIIEIAEEIGKELEVIDILSNSLARVLKSSDHIASEESTGIFYFGADSSTLGIIEGNVLKFERNLPFGIKNIFNEVYEEAAVTALDSKQVINVFENNEQLMMNFENLLASVNNTVRYYNSEKNNKPVTNFIIICADMIMTNMEKYLEKYFELPCILVKDPSDLGLKLKFKDNFPKYISSYGLLLRGNDNKLLNLSPKTIKKEKDKANIDKVLVRVPILILIAVIAIGIPFLVMNKIITKEIANIEADIARYNEIVVKNQQLQSEINKMEYLINRIKDIDNSTSNTSEIISKLNTYVPKEITFEGFSFTDSGLINISGKSSTYSAIPEFLANLEMSEEFCNAKISYINPIEETIEVSSLDEENGSISTRGTFMTIALTGSVNIWDEIIELASDDANDKTNVTQDNSDKTNNGSEGTNSEINKNTIIKYSFLITIEGVSKDGSKAKATE